MICELVGGPLDGKLVKEFVPPPALSFEYFIDERIHHQNYISKIWYLRYGATRRWRVRYIAKPIFNNLAVWDN